MDKVFAVREWRKVVSRYNERKWNREHNPIYIKKFLKTLKGKLYKSRKDAKRRKLGFVPLNKPFEGSVAHHIDKIHVVYVPIELHHSVTHNVWTGHNMEKINSKVKQWLQTETLK